MANIRLDLQVPIENGQSVTFKSPADCSSVTGLKVYYPQDSATVSKTFQFADAHGNNVGGKNLFSSNVFVKVILDTGLSRAYVQNADTNAYLESMFAGDQKPVYSVSSTLTALKSGEKLSVAFGKISKAVSDLISHLSNKQNPHGVTASQIGAASSGHKHSYNELENTPSSLPANGGNADTVDGKHASEFAESEHTHKYAGSSTAGGSATSAEKLANVRAFRTNLGSTSTASFDGSKDVTPGVTGTLPVSNGGTGATTAEKARENLGIITADEIVNLHIWKKCTADPAVYTEDEVTNANITNIASSHYYAVRYAEKINTSAGSISFDAYKVFNIPATDNADTDADVLKDKYVCYNQNLPTEAWYFIPYDATFTHTTSGSTKYLTVDRAIKLTERSGVGTVKGFVASKEKDTYPTNGMHTDNYWYVYHKQLGE